MQEFKQNKAERFGALVGWTHQDLGDRVMVRVQSTRHVDADSSMPVDEFHYLMTKNQAAVLGQYLFGLSGRLPPPAKKRRWFG